MTDREIVNFLLIKEIEISNRIHNAISEIMRNGYESERGKKEVPDMIDSVQYVLEDIERVINR